MNKIENGVIRYQIDFEKYKNGQANEVVALLDDAARDVAKFIKKTGGVYTKKRYLEIARKLRDVSKSLKEGVGASIDIDGLIDYELKKQKSVLNSVKKDIEKATGGAVNFLYPTVEQIKTAALFKPVADSMTYQSYLDGIEAGLYNMWDSAVRAGYLTGQTTQQIVSDVMGGISPQTRLMNPGIIGSLRNSVYGNTRTVLQSFAAETRNRVYRENEQYFGDTAADGDRYKYEYLSTLDNRTCLVCAECGGRLYKELKDAPAIPLHRGCVLGDTLVSTTSGISKVYKRRYKGLLYRITTASGNTLTVTPNHPILTDKGFVRAHLLNVGDNVISNNGLETISIVGENKKNGQAFIKDIFSSFSKSPSMFSCTMPLSAEDFHGDAVYNKVNIITTDRELHSERNIISSKKISKNFFVNRFGLLTDKSHKCRFFQIFCSHFPAFRSLVSIFCKFGDLFWSGMSHALNLLFVPIPLRDIIFSEKSNHSGTPVTKSFSNSSYSDSLIVKFKNFINRKIVCRAFSRSFDIGSVQDVSDDVFGRTVLASNILNGYSAQIKVDNIIAIDVKFSFTHVYNLETENNWYIANGIITHNCRCILLPYFNIDGDTRASKDGYVDNVSFDEWLKGQDEKTQLDVLGRTRFEMYKNGTPITQFVDNGKTLTLRELEGSLENSDWYVKTADITSRKSEIFSGMEKSFAEKEKSVFEWLNKEDRLNRVEKKVILDSKGDVISIGDGVLGSVGFTNSEYENKIFKKVKDRSLVSYHNHHWNGNFSANDIDVLMKQSKIKESVIVCNNRNIYRLSADRVYKNLANTVIQDYNKMYVDFNGDVEKVITKICVRYGLKYSKGVF